MSGPTLSINNYIEKSNNTIIWNKIQSWRIIWCDCNGDKNRWWTKINKYKYIYSWSGNKAIRMMQKITNFGDNILSLYYLHDTNLFIILSFEFYIYKFDGLNYYEVITWRELSRGLHSKVGEKGYIWSKRTIKGMVDWWFFSIRLRKAKYLLCWS